MQSLLTRLWEMSLIANPHTTTLEVPGSVMGPCCKPVSETSRKNKMQCRLALCEFYKSLFPNCQIVTLFSPVECDMACKYDLSCAFWTYYLSSSACHLLRDCDSFDDTSCTDCVTGKEKVEEESGLPLFFTSVSYMLEHSALPVYVLR